MMVRRLVRSRLSWVAGALLAALLVYLALGVFGVHTLFYDTEVNEDFAAAESARGDRTAVSSGEFHAVAHAGTGEAAVYRMEDGSRVLRLENLDIFNGPALYVYAVAAEDTNDDEAVVDAGFLDLGPLKGNKGNQTYKLPVEFDPEKHQSITIWCKRFSVNFATAPLR